MERAYLDHNASSPLRPQARAAIEAALDLVGNPSSVHAEGRKARRLIEDAREHVARLVGADPQHVVFTSGGTEANVLALAPAGPFQRLLVSAIEHPSVLAGGRFAAVTQIPVLGSGIVDLDALRRLVAQGPALVSVMLANNETGVVQPISEVVRIVREAGGRLHVDAVQGPGRITCNINSLQADLITLSGHKIGGPKGVGALVRRSDDVQIVPLLKGGGQERRHRGGTENVPGIAGFGTAAAVVAGGWQAEAARMRALRDRLEAALRRISPDVVIFGAEADRLPNTTSFACPGVKAETTVIGFDLEGIAVSAGAACSSGKVEPSHVLVAMGVEQALVHGGVRVSLGWSSSERDIEAFENAWIKLSKSLGKGQGRAA
jgi:cysteine desulfurase